MCVFYIHFYLFILQKITNFAVVIELERHIEILLLSNECVIVPGLGGFVAHHVEAHYDGEDHLFLPPQKTLGFNPQLKINDSLLVHSYIEAYDISYPEAIRQIESEVAELKQCLHNEGKYEMADIGELSMNAEGNILFEPCEAGILSPELYGLSSFDILPVTETEKENTTLLKAVRSKKHIEKADEAKIESLPAIAAANDDNEEGDDNSTIKIKISWIRNTVAAAAAIIAFLFLSTPVTNSRLGEHKQLAMLNLQLLPQDTGTDKPLLDDAAIKNAVIQKDTTTAMQQSPDTVKTEKAAKTRCFTIVMASHVTKHNAEAFVKQLHKDGLSEAGIYIHNNVVRVVYGNYKTEADAYNDLRTIRSNEDFEEAWVYQVKI